MSVCHIKLHVTFSCITCWSGSFLKSTAGMPLKGLSNTLNCSVPGQGISGLLHGWFFPFPIIQSVSFSLVFTFRPRLVRRLIMISSRIRYRLPLSGGATGKGKSHALQAHFPCLLWYQGELFMPPVKMSFSETPVSSSQGS